MARGRWTVALTVTLIVSLVTCVEQRTPTSVSTSGVDSSHTAVALASLPITQTLLTSGNNPANQKVYTTTSIAPGSNALITVAVLGHNSTSAPPSPTLSGGGMATWTVVSSITLDAVGTPHKRLTIYRAMSATPGSGPLTITWSATVSNCQWIVSQWDGVDASGSNGAGAVVQSGSTSGDATNGLAVPLAAFADPGDVAYGVFAVNKNALAVIPGSGFTEITQQPSAESPNADLEAEWTTNDNTVDASWTGLNGAALGVELKSATGGGGGGGGGGGVSTSLSTVAASPSPIAAGSATSTITVFAKDAGNLPISGATVALSATGLGNTVTSPAGVTDATGMATGTLASTVAGMKTVSAKINGTTVTQTATVTVTPGPVSKSQTTIVASPSAIVPMGSATITVTAKDDFGNPISGATVVLATTGSAVVTQPTDTTNASGVATGSVMGMVEETVTISATVNATAITQTAQVQIASQTAATVTQTLLTSGNNAANQKVYTTTSIAPAANALITIAVLMRRSGGVISPTITGGGMTKWDPVVNTDFDTQGTPTKRLIVFRALSATPSTGPITITFAGSVSNVQWIVSQWDGVDASGTNGSGAIVQTGTGRSDAATNLAVSLAPLASANDVAYGVIGVAKNGPVVTPGAGFAEIAEVSSGETSALEAEWAPNQSIVGVSWTGATKGGILGLEIKAGNAGPAVPVASVTVTPPSAAIVVGGTVQLSAAAADAGGEPIPSATFTWSSDTPGAATVSSTGLVTGKGVGSATISATSGGTSGTATVTVTSSVVPVASVDVTPATADILVGGTLQLTATPKDAAGQPVGGLTITWGGGAAGIATVSSSGLVSGVGAGGPVDITATAGGKTGSSSVTVTSGGQAAQVGQWSDVLPAPIVQVHLHLLADGRVLSFGGSSGIPQVWDPVTGLFTAVPSPALMFCSGHAFLPDGRVLVSGGGTGDGKGHTNSDIFDFATTSWTAGPTMGYARWYPTNTTLPDGEVLTVAGADQNGSPVPIPEIGDGTTWRQLASANLTLSNYPRDFVAPDGRIFMAGPSQPSQWLDVTGTGSWTPGPSMNIGGRSYGAAVMYEAGKILYVGGNSVPTNTAEIIDLNQASPQWSYTGSLTYARWNLNATVLPTGDVLVTGGVSGDRANPALKVNATELWNPTSGTWSLLASSAPLLRGYHSTSLLLPDGRVLHSGGGAGGGTIDNLNFEIFSPPYLFKGARPNVTGVSGTPGYGQTVVLQTPDAASITKVSLIRFGSVTHAFDQGQRLISMSFTQVSDGISVTLPSSRNIAPPGPYMLFLVNGNGVPAVGRIMVLR